MKVVNPLFDAISEGKLSTVENLLKTDPEFYNHVNEKGETPITLAHRCKQHEIVKYLEESIADPKMSMDKIISSNYSWMYLERDYFSSSFSNFRNYYLANVRDKWGRNAVTIMMSSIAIILSSPTNFNDPKSGPFRDQIYRAENQWKKIEIFIRYGVKLDYRDEPLTLFFKSLSKLLDENAFGYDCKSKQDKGKHYRDLLADYLKSMLLVIKPFLDANYWISIKEHYESCKWGYEDLLVLLTKWYPELGYLLPELINLMNEKKLSIVETIEQSSSIQKIGHEIELSSELSYIDLERLCTFLNDKVHILCGQSSNLTILTNAIEQYLIHLGTIINNEAVQKILKKEEIHGIDSLLLHKLDLDLGDIIKLKDNLDAHYSSIKVIITTNRTDIITIFSKNIFYVQNKASRLKINRCHPILANLRLTKGLRSYHEIGSHLKVKVYVDSRDGLIFCRKIYEFLLQHKIHFGISDRYRPEFTLLNDVRKTLNDYIFHHDKSELIVGQFAILEKISSLRRKELEMNDPKFIFIKRSNLENYLYDPFVLCSVLSVDKLKMIGNQRIRQVLIDLKHNMIDFVKFNDQSSEAIQNLQNYFNCFQPDSKDHDLSTSQSTEISLFNFHDGKMDRFDCLYPTSFLNTKGFDVVKSFDMIHTTERGIDIVANNANKFHNILLESIATCDNICIPSDLIEMFVLLNGNMRQQINKQIKVVN